MTMPSTIPSHTPDSGPLSRSRAYQSAAPGGVVMRWRAHAELAFALEPVMTSVFTIPNKLTDHRSA